jgi:hypothetical protein
MQIVASSLILRKRKNYEKLITWIYFKTCIFFFSDNKLASTPVLLRRRQQRPFFPRGKVRQVSLLQQDGGRLRAGDRDHHDHRDR